MRFSFSPLVAISMLGLNFVIISPSLGINNLTQIAQNHNNATKKGGQVLEIGSYHLEFVPEPSTDTTHLDFYLQNGSNHQSISNAKVIAQIQLPDGTKKNLELPYDAKGKHYTAMLPGKATGEYKVTFLCDINGKKINGRFSFKR